MTINVVATWLDEFLPRYDFKETHAIAIHAPPSQVFHAIKELTPAELSPLVHWLFVIRALPARLRGKRGLGLHHEKPILDQVLGVSFILLAEEAEREIVLGTIGQFWRPMGGTMRKPAHNAQEFMAFDQPDYAKAVMNFRVSEEPERVRVRVTTETRIFAPDPRTRAKFALYWRLIYPGSALIRIMWLRAIRKRAENRVDFQAK